MDYTIILNLILVVILYQINAFHTITKFSELGNVRILLLWNTNIFFKSLLNNFLWIFKTMTKEIISAIPFVFVLSTQIVRYH